MATLELSLRDPAGEAIPVSARGLRIGREAVNDLVLDSARVSRRHAVVVHLHGRLAIHDENSTNGTFVNNHRVCGTVGLQPGDAIGIGGHTLVVEAWPRPSAPPSSAPRRRRVLYRRG